MAHTKDDTLRRATNNYLDSLIGVSSIPKPPDIAANILDSTCLAFDLENTTLPKGRKWKIPDRLQPVQLATIICRLHPVAAIETAGENSDKDYTLLGLYQDSGPNEGIYECNDEAFENLAEKYCYGMTERETREMFRHLKRLAPRKRPCCDPNLIAVNNGIFNYVTKQLLPFSPDYVFLTKSRVNYNPQAKNITIHNPDDGTDWDVESWMSDLSDDPEIVDVLWKVLGAIIRPNVPWNVSAWFYSESGNNGKGTLCQLMRNLCGEGSYATISLADMSKDFMLEPLTRATAIIVDENDVGTYIDKAANLKAIVTGDAITINRKFKTALPFQFHGFMVQCLNEMPRIRDKTDSFYRRQLFIPFTKCFTGKERKYIKNDYLCRQEVLEYVLYRVLNMNYNTIVAPAACRAALDEYKEFNDPIRQFTEEIFPELKWDLVPFSFLYDLYVAWYKKNFTGRMEMKSMVSFTKDIVNMLPEYTDWYCDDKRKARKPGNKMDAAEPLIAEYNLTDWMDPKYVSSKDKDKMCHPLLKANYRGILRKTA